MGWGQQTSYVIAFSAEGATDVTRRYVRRERCGNVRNRCPEPVLVYILDEINRLRQGQLDVAARNRLKLEALREQQELQESIVSAITADFLSSQREPAARGARAGEPGPKIPEVETCCA
ncbi:hypothetical protein HRG_009589 [Hirsutella rhossiliensis]|uniref:Uncharacterized protein n=1 Tax=Hirsutella rhossiliensis TaxID=111463 RepID=A0A9P8MMV5_9HYPO|nr:uncharacterized protein HRG_09589 [Hirsutella rhossiliensis]KAH0959128.1 hypothetical protein HRG_09589 [Hirsutella rhossiliensis]